MSNSAVDPWDEWDTGGEFVKWQKPGDQVVGRITKIGPGKDFDGNTVPQVDLETDEGTKRSITVAQANLAAQFREIRPKVGDRIWVKYARDEKAEKGMKKVFEIKVDVGGQSEDTPPF
jgi:hypothetical protein